MPKRPVFLGGRKGERHFLFSTGDVHCERYGEERPPQITHSAVKCASCGKTLAGIHVIPGELQAMMNPRRRKLESNRRLKSFGNGLYLAWLPANQAYAAIWSPSGNVSTGNILKISSDRAEVMRYIEDIRLKNPTKGHLRADIRAFDRVTREMSRLKTRDRRELRRNPVEYPAGGGWVVREYPYGDVPAVVMHNKRNGRLAYLLDGENGFEWRHASDVPSKVKDRAIAVLVHRRRPSFYKSNPVPSYALILRRKLEKGHPQEEAEELARRELQQAAEFLRVPYTESRRRNPASSAGKGALSGGRGPIKIYGQTERIFMKKTSGPYKGQKFVHDFKGGVEQIGFPRGTVLRSPDGRTFHMSTRCVVLSGKKDLYRNFPA